MNEAEIIAAVPKTEPCACEPCRAMCKRPCWPTPAEAVRLMDAGYASRLMLDSLARENERDEKDRILILCPANPGMGGKEVDYDEVYRLVRLGMIAMQLGNTPPRKALPIFKGCTFYYRGKCRLHDDGLKPLEGRLAHHGEQWHKSGGEIHVEVGGLWDSKAGRALETRSRIRRIRRINAIAACCCERHALSCRWGVLHCRHDEHAGRSTRPVGRQSTRGPARSSSRSRRVVD